MAEPKLAISGTSVPLGGPSGLRFMAQGTPIPHDGVVYHSRGTVLVIGDSHQALETARELLGRSPTLQIALFAPGVGSGSDLPKNIVCVGGRIVSVQGYLGHFSASVRVAIDKVEDAGIFSANADRYFDLVLDLSHQPLLRQSVLPHGYYAPGDDPVALLHALDSLPQLVGGFHKPEYLEYLPQVCAHGAKGFAGCTRCLEVCSAEAISSTGERIAVDPFLCQGCASCTLACPTGALAFTHPAAKDLKDSLAEALSGHDLSAREHVLVVHDAASRHDLQALDATAIPLEVNPLSAFSESLWLSALLAGVNGVVLVISPAACRSRSLLEHKIDEVRTIISSLGGRATSLQIVKPPDVQNAIEQAKRDARQSVLTRAEHHRSSGGKRANLLALFDAFSPDHQTSGTCALNAGAAFGTVLVDNEKCTVCHACVNLCPTGALSGQNVPVPALNFRESLCVQCDLCRSGCPEKAISLQARFLPDVITREEWREVAHDQLVPCVSCGAPFTGKRKLALSLALMQEHAKDLPGGLDSLRMCPGCRQHETMTT